MNKKELKVKKKINKKGFTLIELLAVIVVLAIVLVVTIPSVLSSMKNAREKQFENAVVTVKEWFEKQYDAYTRLGEEYASDVFVEYLNTKCGNINEGDLTSDQKKEILKCRNRYQSLTADIIKVAGLDPADINYTKSYVSLSEEGKAEINLVATSTSKFSNGNIAVVNSNDSNNLFDLDKRMKKENTTDIGAAAVKEILMSNYYYTYNAIGAASRPTNTKIIDLSIENNEIHFKNGGTANFGILVPFDLNPGSKYRFEFTRGNNDSCSKACIEIFDSTGKYLSNSCLSNASSKDFIVEKNNTIIGIFFYCDVKTGTAEINNISLTKVS